MLTEIGVYCCSSTTNILFTILLLTAFIYTVFRSSTRRRNIPPYPVKPLPFIGHMLIMGKDPREKLKAWRDEFGDLFSLQFGSKHMVVINGYDAMREILVKHADKVQKTPKTILPTLLNEYNIGIMRASGPQWKENRTIAMAILKSFGVGRNVLADRIQKEVDIFIEEIAKFKGEPNDFSELTTICVSNIISSIVFGKRFRHDDPLFQSFITGLQSVNSKLGGVAILSNIPILRFLPGDPFDCKAIINHFDFMKNEFILPEINRGKGRDSGEDVSESFISAFLKEMRQAEHKDAKKLLDETNLYVIVRNLYEAGTDTISLTICWFLYYLIHHQHVQDKIYHEIRETVGPDRTPTVHDRPKLTYLTAAIMETQRIVSLVPFSQQRIVKSDLHMAGYDLPAGTVIAPLMDSVLWDKKLWGDPETFRPERFLDEHGHVIHPPHFIPFSMGRRLCIGEAMAKMELYMFLSALVHRFQILPSAPGELPSLKAKFGISTSTYPCKIRLVDRSTLSQKDTSLQPLAAS